MKDKVSIIIPCFNYGKFLQANLNCLIQQSHANWEAIIIDDGSWDDTEEKVYPYLRKDKRILYFKQSNKGVSAARNLGLQYASGDFIQFLDADDLLSAEKLSLQLDYFDQHPETDICYTNNHYFRDGHPSEWFPDLEMKGKSWMPKLKGKDFDAVKTLVQNNIAVISSPLFRSRILEKVSGFPEDVAHTEDWQFWFECAFANYSFHYFSHPQAYTLIRIHTRSTSQDIYPMRCGELRLRNWVNKKIKESAFTLHEKNELAYLNREKKYQLFKYMMYYGPLLDLKHLQNMADLTDWQSVISYYFKALNFKRKTKINQDAKRDRHHHPFQFH